MTYYKHLPVPGLLNCRDLGGFACDGGITRYGVFLRSEAPCQVSEAGLQWLLDYGLSGTIDLRGEPEIAWRPSALADKLPYSIVPLRGGAETFEQKNLPQGPFSWDKVYIKRAKEHRAWIRDAVRACIDAPGCTLFHCTTGKDRTGIVACCLLGAVGVRREDIAGDYCLSQVYLQPMFAAMRAGTLTIREGKNHFEDYVFQTPFEAMEKFYDFLTGEYGSVAGYLLDIGITPQELTRLREKFVEAQ